jgi:hypothetical protein
MWPAKLFAHFSLYTSKVLRRVPYSGQAELFVLKITSQLGCFALLATLFSQAAYASFLLWTVEQFALISKCPAYSCWHILLRMLNVH